MKKLLSLTSASALALFLCSGCSSIICAISGTSRPPIQLTSNPSGATVTVTGDNGMVVTAKTPAVVNLRRGRGYFKGAHYTVKFELAGYNSFEAQINPSIYPWYWGNFGFGGLIGFLGVDPATGAMWALRPHGINANMATSSASPSSFVPEQQNAAIVAANAPQKSESASPQNESPK